MFIERIEGKPSIETIDNEHWLGGLSAFVGEGSLKLSEYIQFHTGWAGQHFLRGHQL